MLYAYEGVQIMANYAASIVVKDIAEETNPNEYLAELYFMGLWPRGITSNQFVVLIPNSGT